MFKILASGGYRDCPGLTRIPGSIFFLQDFLFLFFFMRQKSKKRVTRKFIKLDQRINQEIKFIKVWSQFTYFR